MVILLMTRVQQTMKLRAAYIIAWTILAGGLQAQDYTTIINSLSSDKQKADTIFSFARKNFRKGRFDSVAYWLNFGQTFADRSGDDERIARYYIEKGNMNFMMGKPGLGIPEIRKANNYLDYTDSYDLHNSALLIMGNCFAGLQQSDSALYYFRKCEEYNNVKFPYRNWLVYSAIADLYRQTEDNKNALLYFTKAYDLTLKKDGKPDHGYVLAQMANYFLGQNNSEEFGRMLNEYNELMKEKKRNTDPEPAHNFMFISWSTNKIEDKVKFMQEVKETSLKGSHYDRAMLANSYIINLYEKNKQYEEALKYVAENETITAGTGNVTNVYVNAKIKYTLLKKAGKLTEAAAEADRLFSLKDSIISVQRRQQMYELETKYETEKKQKEIQLLASQKELGDKTIALLTADKKLAAVKYEQEQLQNKSLELENLLMDSIVKSEKAYNLATINEKEKQVALNAALDRENKLRVDQLRKERNTKWVLAAGIGLLLLSGIIILVLYGKQRKKNVIIQKQSSDLVVLMKEIHHRVKNNLQIVSSLLDLQSHYITDTQASEAVKEGKNRVQSMALIHQNLYSEGNIKGIQVKDYISNLVKTLCDSYNISNDKVKINSNIDNLNLDVDTMIPLGLVINELVSNAFKYAFNDQQTGELDITLKGSDDNLHLMVKDNGRGFPEGLDVKNSKSFGLKMIRAFAQKLKAKLNIYNNNGAVVEMEISKFKVA